MSTYRTLLEKWGDQKLSDVIAAMTSSVGSKPHNNPKLANFILNVSTQLGITFHDSAPLVAQAIDDDIDNSYPLENKGCVLIISNSFKNGGTKKRTKASAKDVENMVKLWKEDIGCELFDIRVACGKQRQVDKNDDKSFSDFNERRNKIREKLIKEREALEQEAKQNKPFAKPYEDLTAEEMKEVLTCFSEIEKDYAYIVVIISTHGGLMSESEIIELERSTGPEERSDSSQNGGESTVAVFFGDDEKPVREKEIIELFYNDANKPITGIPKFFILDYCRAELETRRAKGLVHEPHPPQLPLMSDMLAAYATHRSHLAFDGENGSWLITAIYEVFRVCYEEKNVLDMLTKVNNKVKDKCGGGHAMSVFESSLVKDFRLWQKPPTTECHRLLRTGFHPKRKHVACRKTNCILINNDVDFRFCKFIIASVLL